MRKIITVDVPSTAHKADMTIQPVRLEAGAFGAATEPLIDKSR